MNIEKSNFSSQYPVQENEDQSNLLNRAEIYPANRFPTLNRGIGDRLINSPKDPHPEKPLPIPDACR